MPLDHPCDWPSCNKWDSYGEGVFLRRNDDGAVYLTRGKWRCLQHLLMRVAMGESKPIGSA